MTKTQLSVAICSLKSTVEQLICYLLVRCYIRNICSTSFQKDWPTKIIHSSARPPSCFGAHICGVTITKYVWDRISCQSSPAGCCVTSGVNFSGRAGGACLYDIPVKVYWMKTNQGPLIRTNSSLLLTSIDLGILMSLMPGYNKASKVLFYVLDGASKIGILR